MTLYTENCTTELYTENCTTELYTEQLSTCHASTELLTLMLTQAVHEQEDRQC